MHCPNCHHPNQPEAKFCSNCGTKLTMICPKCQNENLPNSRYCSACGTPLQTPDDRSERMIEPKSERRQVTAMFCDLVGSTALSEKLDPEQYSTMVSDYQQLCKDSIDQFGGEIHEFLGDGVVTFFGFPVAHEDDALRSVQCGLDILKRIEQVNKIREKNGLELIAARIGIHTGTAVAGEIVGRKQVLGKTPNIAARLEGLADVNSVVISPATFRLVPGYFEVQSMGNYSLKGISSEMELFRVIGSTGKTHRLDFVPEDELSPFVGRAEEVAHILDLWQVSAVEKGKVVLVKGDAGIGKSRLIHQVKKRIAALAEIELLEVQTSSMLTNSSLYPLIELLQSHLKNRAGEKKAGFELDDLRSAFEEYHFDDESLLVLAGFVSASLPPSFERPYLSAAKQKQIGFEIITKFVLHQAVKKPLLLLFEDLHWSDHSTLEWISSFLDRVSTNPIFTLITTRPMSEYPDWVNRSEMAHLTLNPLEKKEVQAICHFKCKGIELPQELVFSIAERTDGIPLYVEEFTSDILESGSLQEKNGQYFLAEGTAGLKIPATLQDSLTSRLDRHHPQEKAIAQLGAILGREFSYEILREMSGISEEALAQSLDRLQASEILYVRGTGTDSRYIFKHALIQDAAYDSLLSEDRKSRHRKVAETIASKYPKLAEGQPELLAYHLTKAEEYNSAMPKWLEAGQKAMQQNANLEAVHHMEQALEISEKLPHSFEKVEKEIQTLLMLGSLYTSTKSYAGREVEDCYQRALELSKQSGNAANLFYVNCGLVGHSFLSGNIDRAFELTNTLFQIANNSKDLTHHFVATSLAAWTNVIAGNFLTAKELFEEAFPLFDEEKHAFLTMLGYGDIHCLNLEYYEFSLIALGFLAKASAANEEARQRMIQMNHLQTKWAYYCDSGLAFAIRREREKLLEVAAVCYPMALEAKEEFIIVFQKFFYGYAKSLFGEMEMIDLAYEGMNQMNAIGNVFASSWEAILLVDLEIDNGNLEKAAELLDMIDQIYDKAAGKFMLNEERHRVQGRYYEKAGQLDKAVFYYQRAIDLARIKEAKFFELRASICLGQLWKNLGKDKAAFDSLEAICGWFSDRGESSVDLQQATAILDKFPKT